MSSYITIGSGRIGIDYPPYFIADIAANHDGDIDRAYRLIELAKNSGAHAAKFQNFKAAKIVSRAGFDELQGQLSHQKNWKKSVFETYEDASIADDWTPLLKKRCDEVGIEYMTSPYDFESVDWANGFVNAYKIGSGDISWHEMLSYIALKNKPVLLACGASTMQEVENAVDVITAKNNDIVLMQCNTNYTANPADMKYININVLKTFEQRFPNMILGLSDHTKGYTTVLGAVALGARVIEKHFTDDNARTGPDHAFSTTPQEWQEMVKAANDLFYALGDGIKRIEGNELQTCIVQKRGLYSTVAVNKGDIISADMFEPLRPRSDSGFEPYELRDIIGRQAKRSIAKGEMLKREDILDV